MKTRKRKTPFEEYKPRTHRESADGGRIVVGGVYICQPQKPFTGQIRGQIRYIYKKSAAVNILSCFDPDDDALQHERNYVTVIGLNSIFEECD